MASDLTLFRAIFLNWVTFFSKQLSPYLSLQARILRAINAINLSIEITGRPTSRFRFESLVQLQQQQPGEPLLRHLPGQGRRGQHPGLHQLGRLR